MPYKETFRWINNYTNKGGNWKTKRVIIGREMLLNGASLLE